MSVLDIGDSDFITEHVQRALDAAKARVQRDAAAWLEDHDDEPDEELVQAVLRAVQVLRVNAPDDGWRTLARDRIYLGLISGHRSNFGIA